MYFIFSLFPCIEKKNCEEQIIPMNVGSSDSNLIWIPSPKLLSLKLLFKKRGRDPIEEALLN